MSRCEKGHFYVAMECTICNDPPGVSESGVATDSIAKRAEDMEKLLHHCKMYIFEGRGYCSTRKEELDVIRHDFELLGL